jgi:hypothetical protein
MQALLKERFLKSKPMERAAAAAVRAAIVYLGAAGPSRQQDLLEESEEDLTIYRQTSEEASRLKCLRTVKESVRSFPAPSCNLL